MPSLLQKPVSVAVNALLKGKDQIRVLEAGCGSASQIEFKASVFAVGIDISPEELEKNTVVHERILGDIQDYPLPEAEFDAIVCWMVLEHLARPKDALANLFRAAKPGGIVILGFPNFASIKGLVTKFTPFWFHMLFYRMMRYKSRHFPTYLRAAILPARVVRFAEANGFSLAFCKLAEGGVSKKLRSRSGLANAGLSAVGTALRIVSLGKWQTALLDECAVIFQRHPGPLARSRPSVTDSHQPPVSSH